MGDSPSKRRYDAANYYRISVKIHRTLDREIMEELSRHPSMGAYIKDLIREDIKKGGR